MNRVRPILFKGDMVRAILDDRKTVTRRVIRFPENSFTEKIPEADNIKVCENTLFSKEISFIEAPSYTFDLKPPYRRGDILYVRETYCPNYFDFVTQYGNKHGYKADYDKAVLSSDIPEPKWMPSIHMPKEAARIWLKVTDVKVERLQEITIDECEEEGCWCGHNGDIFAFMALWDSTIKKTDREMYGWDVNPWVWVIKFERCGKPEVKSEKEVK